MKKLNVFAVLAALFVFAAAAPAMAMEHNRGDILHCTQEVIAQNTTIFSGTDAQKLKEAKHLKIGTTLSHNNVDWDAIAAADSVWSRCDKELTAAPEPLAVQNAVLQGQVDDLTPLAYQTPPTANQAGVTYQSLAQFTDKTTGKVVSYKDQAAELLKMEQAQQWWGNFWMWVFWITVVLFFFTAFLAYIDNNGRYNWRRMPWSR